WARAYSAASIQEVPLDFQAALEGNEKARVFFEALNKTQRYAFLWRIEAVKRAETRRRKIGEMAATSSPDWEAACAFSPAVPSPPRRMANRTNITESVLVFVIGRTIRKHKVPPILSRLLFHTNFLATKSRTYVSRPPAQHGCQSHSSRKCYGHGDFVIEHHHALDAAAIILSAPAASCNPSGWDCFSHESRLRFSPGVCPKGWIYHDMAEDGLTGASTAFCCQSGFSNQKAVFYTFYGSRDCVSWVTASDSAASTTTSQQTIMMHEAWAVTWDATDTSTLTPKLPT
ncbi:hypothetical protein CMUS01_16751, partial [Colletotrichum musicola]